MKSWTTPGMHRHRIGQAPFRHPGVDMTLDQAVEGRTYRIAGITGGREVLSRLASLGVLPGQTIKVIQANSVGPVIISGKPGKLALGRGICHKITLIPDRNGQSDSWTER